MKINVIIVRKELKKHLILLNEIMKNGITDYTVVTNLEESFKVLETNKVVDVVFIDIGYFISETDEIITMYTGNKETLFILFHSVGKWDENKIEIKKPSTHFILLSQILEQQNITDLVQLM